VDSVGAIGAPLVGASDKASGNAILASIAHRLQSIANKLHMAVVVSGARLMSSCACCTDGMLFHQVVNNVVHDRSSGAFQPALGALWTSVPGSRVMVEDSGVVRLLRSSHMPLRSSAEGLPE
jgi:hypothetical protein